MELKGLLLSLFFSVVSSSVFSVYFADECNPPPEIIIGSLENGEWKGGFRVSRESPGLVCDWFPVVKSLSKESIQSFVNIMKDSGFRNAAGIYELQTRNEFFPRLEIFGKAPSKEAYDKEFLLVPSAYAIHDFILRRSGKALIFINLVSKQADPEELAKCIARWRREQRVGELEMLSGLWVQPIIFAILSGSTIFWFLSLQGKVRRGVSPPAILLAPLVIQLLVFLRYLYFIRFRFFNYSLQWELNISIVIVILCIGWIVENVCLLRIGAISALVILILAFFVQTVIVIYGMSRYLAMTVFAAVGMLLPLAILEAYIRKRLKHLSIIT